jgi:hypothetical protein
MVIVQPVYHAATFCTGRNPLAAPATGSLTDNLLSKQWRAAVIETTATTCSAYQTCCAGNQLTRCECHTPLDAFVLQQACSVELGPSMGECMLSLWVQRWVLLTRCSLSVLTGTRGTGARAPGRQHCRA